jgi:hypothetical protein
MLLDVEVSVRVEAADGQQVGEEDAYGVRYEFCDQRYYVDAWIA